MLKKSLVGVLILVCMVSFGGYQGALAAKQFLAVGGGPVGGTFNYFANAIAIYLTKSIPDVEVSSEGSGGSVENLKRLHKGDIDFGLVYSGDAYLGRQGKLVNDESIYDDVRVVSYLYGAPAQLVVLKNSGITSAKQLEGKKVAVGNAGSGAALSAERFFKAIGIWDKIKPQFLGYSAAASAFKDRQIDAFWVLVGFPNASIIEAGTQDEIVLLSLNKEAEEAGFYKEYPFYGKVVIPKGTYKGVDEDVETFQDSTLWCAGKKVSEDIVYNALNAVYSPEGLEHMVTAHNAAAEMKVENGLLGTSVPVHKGAYKFWTEKGLTVSDEYKPAD